VGAVLGAVLVNFGKTYFTGALPELWLFALGLLFIGVTLFMPRGVLGVLDQLKDLWPRMCRLTQHLQRDH
jgi:urea transport system permease protein